MINPSLEHVVLLFLAWIELPVYGFVAKKASFLISQMDTAADVLVLLALLMQSEYCDLYIVYLYIGPKINMCCLCVRCEAGLF